MLVIFVISCVFISGGAIAGQHISGGGDYCCGQIGGDFLFFIYDTPRRISEGYTVFVSLIDVVRNYAGMFLALFGFLFFGVILSRGGSKRARRKAKGEPLGGSHAAEGMILDKHYEDPIVRHGARRVRDLITRL
ncbi:hypothetical protein [Magnetospirillum sp. 15-1]|uniref:hypothetical protein n=1 Tax=Magnetospirillum sp. 15-1 TaxID=1979370 RepID=UPI001483A295|nr:hypothetical protein [Magnetospirillum sp. 15-1]